MPIKHEVQEGEGVVQLADQYGFFAVTIWDYSENATLKQKRKDMNVLMPGDLVVIPDKKAKDLEKSDKKRHRFKRKGVPAKFRLQLFDVDKPRASQAYRLEVDGTLIKGSTDGDGIIETFISPNAREGRLVMEKDGAEFRLAFGTMDPIDEIVGVQKRLTNLGLFGGEATGVLDGLTRAALRDFQARFKLPITGESDSATRAKLEEVQDLPSSPLPPEPSAKSSP